MIPLAERLIASLVNNNHSAVQQCKVGLASSAADGLSIVPSDVVGPLDTCAIDGNGTRARIFSFADNSDEEPKATAAAATMNDNDGDGGGYGGGDSDYGSGGGSSGSKCAAN